MTRPVIIPEHDEDIPSCTKQRLSLDSTARETGYDRIPSSSSHLFSLQMNREREGRCSDCGIQTHSFETTSNEMHVKVPLTIRDEVYRGRCLLCHPLPSWFQKPKKHDVCKRSDSGHVGGPKHLDDADDSAELANILYSMRQCPFDETSQGKWCESLWIYSWDDEASSVIGALGGIVLVISAMARFPDNAFIQLCACGALENLAANSNNRSQIVNAGGVYCIAQAMMRHNNEKKLEIYGLRALDALR